MPLHLLLSTGSALADAPAARNIATPQPSLQRNKIKCNYDFIVLQHCCTRNLKNILIPDAPFSIQMFICFNSLLYSFSPFLIFFSSTVLLLLYPIWHSTYLSLALLLFLLYIFFRLFLSSSLFIPLVHSVSSSFSSSSFSVSSPASLNLLLHSFYNAI